MIKSLWSSNMIFGSVSISVSDCLFRLVSWAQTTSVLWCFENWDRHQKESTGTWFFSIFTEVISKVQKPAQLR